LTWQIYTVPTALTVRLPVGGALLQTPPEKRETRDSKPPPSPWSTAASPPRAALTAESARSE
jgi:hypothetical protein